MEHLAYYTMKLHLLSAHLNITVSAGARVRKVLPRGRRLHPPATRDLNYLEWPPFLAFQIRLLLFSKRPSPCRALFSITAPLYAGATQAELLRRNRRGHEHTWFGVATPTDDRP